MAASMKVRSDSLRQGLRSGAAKPCNHIRCECIATRLGERDAKIVQHFEKLIGRVAAFDLELEKITPMRGKEIAHDFVYRRIQAIEAGSRIAEFAMAFRGGRRRA